MAKLKLIDTKDKFLLEIDGTEIPYVTSYQITRTVSEELRKNSSMHSDRQNALTVVPNTALMRTINALPKPEPMSGTIGRIRLKKRQSNSH